MASVSLAGMVLSIWAIYNGAPLLYADSIDYLLHGGEAWRVLAHGAAIHWATTRSFFYALAILPLHAAGSAWPIVAAQAVATASVLWWTLRATLRRTSVPRYLAVVTLLTLVTPVGWFVGYVMPDLLASLLVLGTALLCFAGADLHRFERAALALLVWLAIVSHGSHLLLAAVLVPIVALLGRVQGGRARAAARAAAPLLMLVVVGAVSTLTLHRALLGEASISGRRPLFLLARALADGPTRTYLRAHCHERDFAICAYADHLPHDVRDVLWSADSVWGTASPATRERLRREELQVVWDGVRSDPLGQLRASLTNFGAQLVHFGMQGSYFPDPYLQAHVAEALPADAHRYFASREAHQRLDEALFSRVQHLVVWASLLAIVVFGALLGRAWPPRLTALAALVGFAVVANAGITGVLSNVEDRYQARVVWLVPLLACLVVLAWLDTRDPGPRGPLSSGADRQG